MAEFFLGVVADDFTGASNAASFLEKAGVSTVLFSGIPGQTREAVKKAQAVVIALKSRTAPRDEAVEESLKAFLWLKEMGAEKLYFKYCSTFDSTAEGNIGPVMRCRSGTLPHPLYSDLSFASGERTHGEKWYALCKLGTPGKQSHAGPSSDAYERFQPAKASGGPGKIQRSGSAFGKAA